MKKTSLLEFLRTAQENGRTARPVMDGILPFPMNKKQRIVIADGNAQGFIQDGMEYQADTPREFAWAQEALKTLKAQYDSALKHPENHWLIKLFSEKRGILAISNYGDTPAVINTVTNKKTLEKKDGAYVTMGSSMTALYTTFLSALSNEVVQKEMEGQLDMDELDACLNVLASGKVNIVALNSVTTPDGTTLVHELTHQTDNGISQSKLFQKICSIESTKGGAVSKIHDKMAKMLKDGVYTQVQYHEEMLARVVQERTSNPEQFKRQNPLMDSFLENVFYPLCMARVCGSENAEHISKSADILNDAIESSDRNDEKLNSDKYMKSTYARRLVEEMKNFREKNIPRYLEEASEEFNYQVEHPEKHKPNAKTNDAKLTILKRAFASDYLAPKPENEKAKIARYSIVKKLEDKFLRRG